jgi:hypothetical protein
MNEEQSGTIPERERAELIAAQRTHLVLNDPGKCAAAGPGDRAPCVKTGTHYVERRDYRYGVISRGMFRPALDLARVCDRHAEALRREPGLVVLRPLVVQGSLIDVLAEFLTGRSE